MNNNVYFIGQCFAKWQNEFFLLFQTCCLILDSSSVLLFCHNTETLFTLASSQRIIQQNYINYKPICSVQFPSESNLAMSICSLFLRLGLENTIHNIAQCIINSKIKDAQTLLADFLTHIMPEGSTTCCRRHDILPKAILLNLLQLEASMAMTYCIKPGPICVAKCNRSVREKHVSKTIKYQRAT